MERASAHLREGQFPWRGLLLTALPPPPKSPLKLYRPTLLKEGKNVLLLVHNLPQGLRVFYWYKETAPVKDKEIARCVTYTNVIQNGPAYSGRETMYTNGSLFLQNVTETDQGDYTLFMLHQNFAIIPISVRLNVYASLLTDWSSPTTAQVSIEAVPPNVAEGKNVLLLVHNLPQTLRVFYWYKGPAQATNNEIARCVATESGLEIHYGPAYSGRETMYTNGSLFFQDVSKKDEGDYTLIMLYQNFENVPMSVRLNVYASLLTDWSSPTTAQVSIEAVPPNIAEGKNVLLLVHNLPQTLRVFYWYKGPAQATNNEIARCVATESGLEIHYGPAYSGRETMYTNGSLFFQDVSKKDEGDYTLIMLYQNFENVPMSVRLNVYASLLTDWSSPTTAQVSIEAVPPNVAEGKNVLLLVHNLPQTLRVFYWYKGPAQATNNEIARCVATESGLEIHNGPAYSGRETTYTNGSLFFQNVTEMDEGDYTFIMLHQNFENVPMSVRFNVYGPSPGRKS